MMSAISSNSVMFDLEFRSVGSSGASKFHAELDNSRSNPKKFGFV